MSISDRKKKILAAVVDEYIRTAEPVGSKHLAASAGLGCSSATIRNELAELVALGYLEQPHTSAGRVPTPMGYRMYVNELMQQQKYSLEETEEIVEWFANAGCRTDILLPSKTTEQEVKEKIAWVCSNFAHTQQYMESDKEWETKRRELDHATRG